MKIYQVWIKGEPLVESQDAYLSSYSTRALAEKALANYKATDHTDSEWFIEEEELDSVQLSAEDTAATFTFNNTAIFTSAAEEKVICGECAGPVPCLKHVKHF